MDTNKVLIILGMHRSGTSLITQWLQTCGLHIGDNLLGPETGNDDGHFEDVDFVNLHQELLVNRQLPGTGLCNSGITGLNGNEKETIEAVIAGKNSKHKQWAWKDPRTCLFLDTYRKLLPDAHYVIILRDYRAVVSSLLNRENKGLQRYYNSKGRIYKWFLRRKRKYNPDWVNKTYARPYLETWIAYSEALLQHIHSLPGSKFAVVKYTALLDDDKPFFNRLTGWQFNLTYKPFTSIFKQQLIGKPLNISKLIKNNALLVKAKRIERKLEEALLLAPVEHKELETEPMQVYYHL